MLQIFPRINDRITLVAIILVTNNSKLFSGTGKSEIKNPLIEITAHKFVFDSTLSNNSLNQNTSLYLLDIFKDAKRRGVKPKIVTQSSFFIFLTSLPPRTSSCPSAPASSPHSTPRQPVYIQSPETDAPHSRSRSWGTPSAIPKQHRNHPCTQSYPW
jgi:hypothetical protein